MTWIETVNFKLYKHLNIKTKNELIISMIMAGYDVHLSAIKTITGLHHPDSKDHFEIILLKRIPGTKAKGGSCFAKGKINWDLSKDTKAWEIILKDLQTKVDKAAVTKMREAKL